MYPPLFGELFWDTSLVVAMSLPDKLAAIHKRYFADFIYGLVHLVPCPSCSNHGVEYVVKHPPTEIDSRSAAEAYIVEFHNSVNRLLKKATFTVDEAKKALLLRLYSDFKDMPLAMKRREEDSLRIRELQDQVQKLQGGGTITTFGTVNSEAFMWISLTLFIL